eukprot:ANDGO_02286.mRNA.1 hypothetical protein
MCAKKQVAANNMSLLAKAKLKFDVMTVAYMLEPWEKAMFYTAFVGGASLASYGFYKLLLVNLGYGY